MSGEVLVDTGAWIALLRRNDAKHPVAAREWASLRRRRARLVTTSFIISESATRLRYDAGLPAALALRERIDRAGELGLLRVLWIDEHATAGGWEIMERYADLPLSLTDATSAAAARRLGVGEVFGFDADFRAMGFVLRPEG